MKLLTALFLAAFLGCGLTGCGGNARSGVAPSAPTTQPQVPEGQIRTAILAHLAHQGTLNLQSFDTEVKQVSVNGDHAQAQVDFRVKNGPGAMSMTYQLQQRDGAWTVLDANPVGSDFSHPPLTGNPPSAPGAPVGPVGPSHSLADTIRSFTGGAAGQPALPPGHPAPDSSSAPR